MLKKGNTSSCILFVFLLQKQSNNLISTFNQDNDGEFCNTDHRDRGNDGDDDDRDDDDDGGDFSRMREMNMAVLEGAWCPRHI